MIAGIKIRVAVKKKSKFKQNQVIFTIAMQDFTLYADRLASNHFRRNF